MAAWARADSEPAGSWAAAGVGGGGWASGGASADIERTTAKQQMGMLPGGWGDVDGEGCVARLDGSERGVAGPGTAKRAAEVADLHREEREAVAASGGVHERVDGVAGQVAEGQPSPTLGTGCSRSMCRWLSPGIVIGWMVSLTGPRARSGASSSSARAGSPAWIASTITNDLPPISAGTCGLCGGPRKRPTVVSSWGRSPWVRSPERAVPRSRGRPGQPLTISPALAPRPRPTRPGHRDTY